MKKKVTKIKKMKVLGAIQTNRKGTRTSGEVIPFLCEGASPDQKEPEVGGLVNERVLPSFEEKLCGVDTSFIWTSLT